MLDASLAPALLATATVPDAITFVVAAVISVGGALGVIAMRNPVHSALMLVMTLFGVAVLFVEEDAQFLAAVQVIVYAGAIVVLFLFVIMLLGVDRREALMAETFRGQRLAVVVVGLFALFEVLYLAHDHWTTGARSVAGVLRPTGPSGASGATGTSNTAELGRSIFTTYLLPFEVTSALLVVAVVGAVVLARRPARRPGTSGGDAASQTIPSDQPLGDVSPASAAIGDEGAPTDEPAPGAPLVPVGEVRAEARSAGGQR